MSKSLKVKRFLAIVMSVFMMMGVFGTGSFAAEINSTTKSETTNTTDLEISFNNISNIETFFSVGFSVYNSGTYQLTLSPANGSAARVKFYKIIGNSCVHYDGITIPQFVSGMPATLYLSIDFDPGCYTFSITSTTTGKTTTGSFTVHDVNEIIVRE